MSRTIFAKIYEALLNCWVTSTTETSPSFEQILDENLEEIIYKLKRDNRIYFTLPQLKRTMINYHRAKERLESRRIHR